MVGRHTASARARAGVLPLLLGVGAVAVVGVGGYAVVSAMSEDDVTGCQGSVTVRIAAAPEIAPAVTDAVTALEADGAEVDGSCLEYDVSATAPAQVAEVLSAESENSPHLWVPDFSVWVARAQATGAAVEVLDASLARTPVVVVGRDVEPPGSWREVGSTTVAFLDPLTSAPSTAALLSAFGEMQVTGASQTEMGAMMVPLAQRYGGQADKPRTIDDVARAAAGGTLGVMTEQQLVALQDEGAAEGLSAAVPRSGTMVLEYPLVSLSSDAGVEHAGRLVLDALSPEDLAEHGFRDAEGGPLGPDRGLGEARFNVLATPEGDAVLDALRQWAVLTVPSRSLAVVDVSGSMDYTDDEGRSRISLAVTAAESALDLFPDSAQIGLWAFSVELGAGGRDYQSLAPVRRLGAATHRKDLARALRELPEMTGEGTGLHDTTLAAVRTLQEGYDARAVNTVILLTDGENDDPGSLSLQELIRTLEREHDPARPVAVIAIGMGPEADAQALRRIAAATGGRSYVAREPADIGEVFVDAMLSR